MAACFIVFAFSHDGEPRECPTVCISPQVLCAYASVFTPEDVKNTHKQREHGITPALLTDDAALQGETRLLS